MKPEIAQKIMTATMATYDAIAADFSASRYKPWEELRRVLDFVQPGDYVLDAGCGNGRVFEIFRGRKINYTGIDSSWELVKIARAKWGKEGACFEVGNVLDLAFPSQSFDLVLSVAVLHHLPSKELRLQAMKEIARVLKPGGILFMTNWNRLRPEDWKFLARYSMVKIFFPFLKGVPEGRGVFGPLVKLPYGLRGSDLDWGDIFIPWAKSGESRYYHVFTRGEVAGLFKTVGLDITDNYCVKNGERKRWWQASNIVIIGRKP